MNINEIEKKINYTFRNKTLLIQAFTRKSYSEERKKFGENIANNELLEFLGDSVLDQILVSWLMKNYACINDNKAFVSEYNEEAFTNTRSNLVNKRVLSSRIDVLELAEYLIMSEGDIVSNIQNQESVKEDLFEAIIGAIALDCNFDYNRLEKVIIYDLLNPSFYIGKNLKNVNANVINDLNEYCQKKQVGNPAFNYYDYGYSNLKKVKCVASVNGFTANAESEDKTTAKLTACKGLLEILKDHFGADDLFEDINLNNAINRLQEFAQKGIVDYPEYYAEETREGWKITCKIKGIDYITYSTENSKKEAKKNAALEMLKVIKDKLMNNKDNQYYEDDDYDD